MVATADTAYPDSLQNADRRRGKRDGEQRIPSLAEVRRRQGQLAETGESLTVGYQVVLLAELNEQLTELLVTHRRAGRAAELQIRQHDDDIQQAENHVRRMTARLEAARAELTAEELMPRNPEEARWAAEMLRHRREVARARRIAQAQDALDRARDRVEQQVARRAATVRQREEEAAAQAARARRLIELYRRRMAEYVDALAGTHPDGRTLYPLLSMPDVPVPPWVTEILALSGRPAEEIDHADDRDNENGNESENQP
jgi:hypothetical protein